MRPAANPKREEYYKYILINSIKCWTITNIDNIKAAIEMVR